ncbi:MAG: beta-ketoacyl synthase N-terminal-like domain-containing protein, partial [Syntrophothermus sp.]
GLISPQKTATTSDFLSEIVASESDFLKCIDPEYKKYIDPISDRRMSRLIKMGISSAKMCVADAGVGPDAIITGTGLGSVEDTEKILANMRGEGQFFNPTPFIQSTYNTISSQIAISMKCHGYNSTYVHRSFSFESGLQDAMMQLDEKIASNILVGGVDEMTSNHLQITRRVGHWKMAPVNNLDILKTGTPGALAGEGSAWFMLSDQPGANCYAEVKAVETFLIKPSGSSVGNHPADKMISIAGIDLEEIDFVLLGNNGDNRFDDIYSELSTSLFKNIPTGYFKHLCGEYYTASGFALWLAANILKRQVIPEIIRLDNIRRDSIRNILIYNQYEGVNHAIMVIGKC